MKKRIEWIDVSKYIGIMAVMLTHSEACTDLLRTFIIPYHLAVFFFCSGYCYNPQDDFKVFLRKKIRQLIIPWFIYSNANILISGIKSFKTHRVGLLTELFRNMLQIRHYDERMWFIPALFSAFIPFFFVIRKYEKDDDLKPILSLCFVLSLIRRVYKAYMNPELLPWKLINLPWHIDYIPTALLFMVVGYLFKKRWESSFDDLVSIKNVFFLLSVYLFIVFVPYCFRIGFWWPVEFIYDHLSHFAGLSLVIMISKIIHPNRYILYVGRNTLIYFCIHNKLLTLTEVVFKSILPAVYVQREPFVSSIFCICMIFVISIILIVPTMFINKYLPWTLGKPLKKEQ